MAETAARLLSFPPMALLVLLLLLLHFSPPRFASGIPSKYDGFYYAGGGRAWEDVVVVDAFLDPLCPDSRDAWAPLKQVVELYSPRVALVVHPFPLPYHSNAFLACRALHIANKLNTSSTFPLLELFFKYQEKYYNGPTQGLTRTAIMQDMAELGAVAVGNSISEFLSGFEDYTTDLAARTSFRYGCTRGVAGAPYFFVNGFVLPGGGSAIDLATWTSIIDPLVKEQKIREKLGLFSFLM